VSTLKNRLNFKQEEERKKREKKEKKKSLSRRTNWNYFCSQHYNFTRSNR